MKKLIFITCLVMMAGKGIGQNIKKLKIDELSDYIAKSNKPLVVNFWATWCAPCVEEIPFFISTINKKYKDQVELLLVSLDIKDYYPQKLQSFVTKRSFTAPVAWLNETNADIFCPKIDNKWDGAIPVTLMVNNPKQYRQFYNRAITQPQLELELKKLVQ